MQGLMHKACAQYGAVNIAQNAVVTLSDASDGSTSVDIMSSESSLTEDLTLSLSPEQEDDAAERQQSFKLAQSEVPISCCCVCPSW